MIASRLTVLVGSLALLGAGAAPAADAPRSAAVVVTMTDGLRFMPDTVRVHVGDTVTWKNTSQLVHTVTGSPEKATMAGSARLPKGAKPFDSGLLVPGKEFSHRFDVVGTYSYFCQPHEGAGMRAVLIVTRR